MTSLSHNLTSLCNSERSTKKRNYDKEHTHHLRWLSKHHTSWMGEHHPMWLGEWRCCKIVANLLQLYVLYSF